MEPPGRPRRATRREPAQPPCPCGPPRVRAHRTPSTSYGPPLQVKSAPLQATRTASLQGFHSPRPVLQEPGRVSRRAGTQPTEQGNQSNPSKPGTAASRPQAGTLINSTGGADLTEQPRPRKRTEDCPVEHVRCDAAQCSYASTSLQDCPA